MVLEEQATRRDFVIVKRVKGSRTTKR